MSPEVIGLIVAAIFGSGGLGAIVNAWITKRSADADALQVWSNVWHANLDRQEIRIQGLERELARNQEYRYRLEAIILADDNHNALPPFPD